LELEPPPLSLLLPLTTKPHKELNSSLLSNSLKLITNSLDLLPNTENHMELNPNSNSDLLNSKKVLLPFMLIQLTPPQKLESTSSLTTPKLNGKKCWDTDLHGKNHPTLEFFQLKVFQLQSTGPPKEPSLQLKIKDNVDHAGLSPPLELLKELNSLPLEHLSHSPNNNSLIAQLPKEIWDAMVV
jgi:hypothetical protein